LFAALGAEVPEFVYVGLLVGADGKKLSKRAEGTTVASLRDSGIPAEAVRAYLEALGVPKHDVHYDLGRIRRFAVEAIERMSDEELAARVGAPESVVPVMRGARDLVEARRYAEAVLHPVSGSEPLPPEAQLTLTRFRELRERANGNLDYDAAKALVRELKAVGGDLHALRLALTGQDKGPELAAVVAALPREETLRRLDAAL
jgi:glutamyl-tRNA synthetase